MSISIINLPSTLFLRLYRQNYWKKWKSIYYKS